MSGKIDHLYVIESKDYIPYNNQALEEYLLDYVNQQSLILYLWQNKNTIVIGKNQNAFIECDVKKLENNDGYLARRLSGGGAVYHDLGNINFTFLSHVDNYDKEKQSDVIIAAMNILGINAVKNNRNDLLVNDKKFSGHAYYSRGEKCYHHGTIMFDVDHDALAEYLTVNMLKLRDKSISSVRSRVINLKDVKEDITVYDIKKALISAFEKIYDLKVEYLDDNDFDLKELDRLQNKYSDSLWRYGMQKVFQNIKENKFDFGIVRIEYDITDDIIDDLVIYTDSLNIESIDQLIDLIKNKNIVQLDISDYDDIQKQIVEFIRG